MTFARTVLIAAASLAVALGSAYAAGPLAKADVGFNTLDKNHDGKISKAEAAGDSKLMAIFDKADKNHDGALSRAEYVATLTSQDMGASKKKGS